MTRKHIDQIKTPTSTTITKVVHESPTSDEEEKRRSRHVFRVHEEPRQIERVHAEAMADLQCLNVCNLVSDNTVFVGSAESPLCRAIMLRGRLGVTNAHLDPNATIGMQFPVFVDGTQVMATTISVDVKKDLLFFRLPEKFRSFRDITGHFFKRGFIKDFSGQKAVLNIVQAVGPKTRVVQRVITLQAITEMELS